MAYPSYSFKLALLGHFKHIVIKWVDRSKYDSNDPIVSHHDTSYHLGIIPFCLKKLSTIQSLKLPLCLSRIMVGVP